MSTPWKKVLRVESAKKEFYRERFILDVTERICERMAERGVSRAQLAEQLGVSKARITQLLSGRANLTLRTVSDIFLALDRAAGISDEALVSIDELDGQELRWERPAGERPVLRIARYDYDEPLRPVPTKEIA